MMSIRLRLTLLYSTILALTLIVFGIALYTIQARSTLDVLRSDLIQGSNPIASSVQWSYLHPGAPQPGPKGPPPEPLDTLSSDQTFQGLRERDIVRVLDSKGALVSSPTGVEETALPLSTAGLQAAQKGSGVWETAVSDGQLLLIYDRPVVASGQVVSIIQIARPLAERDSSLAALSRTLLIAGLLTILIAFGIGWVLAGVALRPIHRISQTAQAIGSESDFSKRVEYHGPNDEIGQLATTFNLMLSRLQDAYQHVSQALSMQRNFVADVSHELRTPLTTVRGNLALLRHDPPLPAEEQADILSDLAEESDRLIRLVNDLLVLARSDAERNLMRQPVSVEEVVEDACRQARQLDPQREIVTSAADGSVVGDRDALKQVLLILLDNALKYSHGTIRVASEALESQVVISVQDGGPGIAPDVLEHVFDRFYRADPEPGVHGFGLGLSIAKAFVEGQGGTIDMQSQPGSGSIVRICLPRA